jgi:hypothetical protein
MLGHLKDVLIKLDDMSRYYWGRKFDIQKKEINNEAMDNYYRLPTEISRLSGKELEEALKNIHKLCLRIDKSIYLPPLGSGEDEKYIPTLFFECDYSKTNYRISYRVEFYRYIKEKGGKLHGIGYRFERHEAGNKKEHDYWHVQLITGIEGINLPECPDWLPGQIPCIPTAANDAVSLLCSLLVSIYGKNTFFKLVSGGLQIKNEYLQPFERLINN